MVWLLFVALYVLLSVSLFVRDATVLVLALSLAVLVFEYELVFDALSESVVA
jgi:hypothetical protein